MERTNSWELFGRLRSTLHAAPLGVQRWRWWLWEFKKLESECDAKLLVFCVFSYFSINICQKLTVPGNQGLKKISIFIIQLSYLPSMFIFQWRKTIQIFNMFQWQPKKTINGNHLCWGMEALQETFGFALTTDLFRWPTPRNGPLKNVMNFEGI